MRTKRRVWICFEAHRPDGRVWAVKWRGRWRLGTAVRSRVSLATVYRGPRARQPRAYLIGQARHVSTLGGQIFVD